MSKQTMLVLTVDTCCRRQFAGINGITLLPLRAKAGMLAIAVACAAPNSNPFYRPRL